MQLQSNHYWARIQAMPSNENDESLKAKDSLLDETGDKNRIKKEKKIGQELYR